MGGKEIRLSIVRDRDFTFRLLNDIISRIKQSAEVGRRLVLILPQPEPLYAWVAQLCNKFRGSCKHLCTFDMDEYADQDGRVAPETRPNAFLHNMRLAAHGPVTHLVPASHPADVAKRVVCHRIGRGRPRAGVRPRL